MSYIINQKQCPMTLRHSIADESSSCFFAYIWNWIKIRVSSNMVPGDNVSLIDSSFSLYGTYLENRSAMEDW